jgi:hypothetical protein
MSIIKTITFSAISTHTNSGSTAIKYKVGKWSENAEMELDVVVVAVQIYRILCPACTSHRSNSSSKRRRTVRYESNLISRRRYRVVRIVKAMDKLLLWG